MKRPQTSRGLLFALIGLGAAATLAAAPPADSPLPRDPNLVSGALPNGLRYFLLPRRSEPDHASLRLIVQAGSLDEHDDERGYAHFIEHMAFEGSTHYPNGQIVEFLQTLGLGFGADLNADTSFTHTLYKLDLPSTRFLPEALQVFRDYADGLNFPAAKVASQKGVILSEREARDTGTFQVRLHWLGSIFAGTTLPARIPIGEVARIKSADPASLQAFYRRCYRPERMIILVVGDIDPAAVAAAVKSQFATLKSPGRRLAPAPMQVPPSRGFTGDVIALRPETAAVVDLVAVVPHEPDSFAGLEVRETRAIVMGLLDRRLSRRAAEDPLIGRAGAAMEPGPDEWFTLFRLQAQAKPENGQRATALVARELARARRFGFSAEEVREGALGLAANLRGYRDQLATLRPAPLADLAMPLLADNRTWPDFNAELAADADFLPQLTPADANAAFNQIFSEATLHLVESRPTPLPGGADRLVADFRAGAQEPLAAPAAAPAHPVLFHYGDSLPPGAVVARRRDAESRIDLATFANGVRLNVRASRGEQRRFGLSARLGSGFADLAGSKPRLEFLALALVAFADLGRNTQEEIRRLMSLHAVTFGITLGDNQTTLNASGPATELPFFLRYLAAFLSDAQLDPKKLPRAVEQYDVVQRREAGSTTAWARNQLLFGMAHGDPRERLPSSQQIAGYPFDEVADWTRRHWLGGPLEVGVTGDVQPDEVIALAAVTIGTLPVRAAPPPPAAGRLVLAARPYRKTLTESLPDQAAALRIGWPAPGGAQVDIAGNSALSLAVDAVVDRLRIRLRETLGSTYSPEGGLYAEPTQPDFRFAWIGLTFDPAHAKAMSEQALAIADQVAAQGLTAEEFERVRAPRRTLIAAAVTSDDWWLHQVLNCAQGRPDAIADAHTLAGAFSAVTREDVNRAAARYLRAAAASTVLVIPRAGSPH